MGEWVKQYPVDYSPTGDTTSQAIKKHMDELDRIYDLLNRVRKFDAGELPPSDPIPYHAWLDTSGSSLKLKVYDGTNWIDIISSGMINFVIPPIITGPNSAKYNTTITLSACGSLTIFKHHGAVIDHYEWQLPDGETVEGDSINYTMPDSTHLGEELTFKCRAVDSFGNASSWTEFKVEVSDNLPPVIESIDVPEVLMSKNSYTFTITASDPEGAELQYKLTCNNSDITIEPSDWTTDNSFTVTLPEIYNNIPVVFTFHVSDGTSEITQGREKLIYTIPTFLAKIKRLGYFDGFCEDCDFFIDADKNIYVAGSDIADDDDKIFIIKLNSQFEILSYTRIKPSSGDLEFYGATIDSAGNIYICGNYLGDTFIIKLSNDLEIISAKTISDSWLYSILCDSSDNIYLCGEYKIDTNNKFAIAKFDTDLNCLVSIAIDTGDSSQNNQLNDIAINNNGEILVCGKYKDNSNVLHGYVAKLNLELSSILAQVIINESGNCYCHNVRVDSNNNVFTTISTKKLFKFNNSLELIKQISSNNGVEYFTIDNEDKIYTGGIEEGGLAFNKFDNSLNPIKGIRIKAKNYTDRIIKLIPYIGKSIIWLGKSWKSPRNVLIGHFDNFENYNGFFRYFVSDYDYVKKDIDLTVTETSNTIENVNFIIETADRTISDLTLFIDYNADFVFMTGIKVY